MIVKVCQFQAHQEKGESLVQIFQPGEMEKAAFFFGGGTAAPLLPEVQQYLSAVKKDANKIHVLVNALGAGEFWSSNINGDYFPESSLIHKGQDFGYETFYNAYPYKHHVNKDPSKSFGRVELAVWNNDMKRVELVVVIDRNLAQRFAATDVVDKLDAGMFPDVSMGCTPAGTHILMTGGLHKNSESVVEGDFVTSHTGKACRVSATMRRRYSGTLYKFKTYGFRRELQLTDEHPLWLVRAEQLECVPSDRGVNKGRKQRHCTPLVKDRSVGCSGCGVSPKYEFNWTRADTAEVGDYLAFPVPQGVDSTVQTVDEARLLGLYLAEGFVQNYNERPLEQITFCLNISEADVAAEIEALGRRLGATVTWQNEVIERSARYVHVVHRELAHKCLTFCGSYAKTKVVSKEVLYMETRLQLAFLGAYLDGDGGTYKGSAYFSTASEQLSDQLFIMLARCGIIASVNEIEHRPSENSVVRVDTTEYQVWAGTDFSTILGPHTRKPVRPSLKVRGQRFFYEHEGTTFIMAPILEITEEVYDDYVYNFSVEGDDSYVAELLATHNCKVPYDLCSICLDRAKYREAQMTYDPIAHTSVGAAVLAVHKHAPITGISVTRNDYCSHLKNQLNKILPDGRKVYAINDFPKFFDISFVFIGADKTAKVMAKLASVQKSVVPSWQVAEQMGYEQLEVEKSFEKAASAAYIPKAAAVKNAFQRKAAEIEKDISPSQFGNKAIPIPPDRPDLPNSVLDSLGGSDLSEALSTPTSMGITLNPREFQRITIIRLGNKPLADQLDAQNTVFPPTDDTDDSVPMGPEFFSSMLKSLLIPHMEGRSCIEPVVRRKIVKIVIQNEPDTLSPEPKLASAADPFLQKIAAAYNGYLDRVVDCLRGTNEIVNQHPDLWSAVWKEGIGDHFAKTAESKVIDARVILGSMGGAWLLSQMAKWQQRDAMTGKRDPTGAITNIVAESPKLLMAAAGILALHQQGSDMPRRAVEAAKKLFERR